MSALPQPETTDHGFVADALWAIRVCLDAPALPLLAIALEIGFTSAASAGEGWSWLLFPTSVVLAGWYGAERTWFLRVHLGARLGLREIPRVIAHHAGPFVRLGFLVVLAFIPVYLLLMVTYRSARGWWLVVSLIAGLGLDIALTFVVPLLAYQTRSAREAMRSGLRMLRSTWPACRAYALVPAMTLGAFSLVFLPTDDTLVRFATVIVTTGLGLIAKGATAAFTIRRFPQEQLDEAKGRLVPPRPDGDHDPSGAPDMQ